MSSRIGKKGLKGQPIYYEQVKHKHTIWLTDESWLMLQKEAKQQKTSVSELIEKYSQLLKLAQNAIAIDKDEQNTYCLFNTP